MTDVPDQVRSITIGGSLHHPSLHAALLTGGSSPLRTHTPGPRIDLPAPPLAERLVLCLRARDSVLLPHLDLWPELPQKDHPSSNNYPNIIAYRVQID